MDLLVKWGTMIIFAAKRRKTPGWGRHGWESGCPHAVFFRRRPPQQPQKIAGNSAWGGQRLEFLLEVCLVDSSPSKQVDSVVFSCS